MTVRGMTAEWTCTRCATTNRKLVPQGTRTVKDRCVHCRATHEVAAADRPTRWNAQLAG